MAFVTFKRRDGKDWTPKYLISIDPEECIGCGRCFKVCTAEVLEMMGITEDGEFCDPQSDDDESDRKVMVIKDAGACIGCEACATVCGKNCQVHEPMTA